MLGGIVWTVFPADWTLTWASGPDSVREVLGPAFRQHCVACHGEGDEREGDVDLLVVRDDPIVFVHRLRFSGQSGLFHLQIGQRDVLAELVLEAPPRTEFAGIDQHGRELAVGVDSELQNDREARGEEHAALEILNRVLGGSGFRFGWLVFGGWMVVALLFAPAALRTICSLGMRMKRLPLALQVIPRAAHLTLRQCRL